MPARRSSSPPSASRSRLRQIPALASNQMPNECHEAGQLPQQAKGADAGGEGACHFAREQAVAAALRRWHGLDERVRILHLDDGRVDEDRELRQSCT